MLKQEKVRATFFVLGEHLSEDRSYAKSMLNRMWSDGHDVGSHSWDHPNLTQLSDSDIRSQMSRTEVLIKEAVGFVPTIMRPPYGYVS